MGIETIVGTIEENKHAGVSDDMRKVVFVIKEERMCIPLSK